MMDVNEFSLDSIDFGSLEAKLEAMRDGGGEVVEDTGDDCESGACKI
jgi:hypothetical protein